MDSLSLSAARRCTTWKLLRAAENSFISRSFWILCCRCIKNLNVFNSSWIECNFPMKKMCSPVLKATEVEVKSPVLSGACWSPWLADLCNVASADWKPQRSVTSVLQWLKPNKNKNIWWAQFQLRMKTVTINLFSWTRKVEGYTHFQNQKHFPLAFFFSKKMLFIKLFCSKGQIKDSARH